LWRGFGNVCELFIFDMVALVALGGWSATISTTSYFGTATPFYAHYRWLQGLRGSRQPTRISSSFASALHAQFDPPIPSKSRNSRRSLFPSRLKSVHPTLRVVAASYTSCLDHISDNAHLFFFVFLGGRGRCRSVSVRPIATPFGGFHEYYLRAVRNFYVHIRFPASPKSFTSCRISDDHHWFARYGSFAALPLKIVVFTGAGASSLAPQHLLSTKSYPVFRLKFPPSLHDNTPCTTAHTPAAHDPAAPSIHRCSTIVLHMVVRLESFLTVAPKIPSQYFDCRFGPAPPLQPHHPFVIPCRLPHASTAVGSACRCPYLEFTIRGSKHTLGPLAC